jgi:hypothetical protein
VRSTKACSRVSPALPPLAGFLPVAKPGLMGGTSAHHAKNVEKPARRSRDY